MDVLIEVEIVMNVTPKIGSPEEHVKSRVVDCPGKIVFPNSRVATRTHCCWNTRSTMRAAD